MSLTEKGLRERKWGPFPALRHALEDKPPSEDDSGWSITVDPSLTGIELLLATSSSAADTIPEKVGRLLEIAASARPPARLGGNRCTVI